MEIVSYYNEVSKAELKKRKEIVDFDTSVTGEISRIENLQVSNIQKLLHPITTIRTMFRYKRLLKIKKQFDEIVNSDILMYDKEGSGDLEEALSGAAKFYKPQYVLDYVRSVRLNNRNTRK